MESKTEPAALYEAWKQSADFVRFQERTKSWSPEIRDRIIFISGVLAREGRLDLTEDASQTTEARQEGKTYL